MPVIMPSPPSTVILVIGIILLFFLPIVGLILIIYYIVERSNYNLQITEMYNQELQAANNEKIERL